LSNENQIDYFDDYIYYVDGMPQASFDASELLICEDHKPVDLNKYGFPPKSNSGQFSLYSSLYLQFQILHRRANG